LRRRAWTPDWNRASAGGACIRIDDEVGSFIEATDANGPIDRIQLPTWQASAPARA
jgi:hypothetical protein